MASVVGVKEKVHSPLYDSYSLPTGSTAAVNDLGNQTLRFFVDVQNKSPIETNLQAAGVLPSLNHFEARAMRVVATSPNPDVVARFIYHSVTRLIVGEKTMIEMPTFYFPGGAGVSVGVGNGNADPMATFRFSTPVPIDPQQNFRVEVQFPRPIDGPRVEGPLKVWVVLDGFLTRDVQ